MQGLSQFPLRVARRLAHFALRLARLSALAASVAAILIVLDTILLTDDDSDRL